MATPWEPEFTRYDYTIDQKQEMYSGYCPIIQYGIKFKLFEGGWSHLVVRECVKRPPFAAVVLYDKEHDTVVLIEQIRVALLETEETPWILEIVAGMVDDNENAEQCAIREAFEEAGCNIEKIIPIGSYWISPGISNEKASLFCGLIHTHPEGTHFGLVHDGEDIKVHVVPRTDAFMWLKKGYIKSAPSVIGLQWLELNYHSL